MWVILSKDVVSMCGRLSAVTSIRAFWYFRDTVRCPFLWPPHTLRFDVRLACAVSKQKVSWRVCGVKTTGLVSLYRLRLGLKEICRRLIFFCACAGKPASKSEGVWCSKALHLVLCCFYPTLKWRDCGWSTDSVSRISNRIHSHVSRISVLVEN